jgi:DNA-binding transcriptional ArsR family regulator
MSLEVSNLRATAHPVRLQMLSLLTGAAMSAAELARELGITQANASYHLRTLVRAGLVTEAGEERVRGGVAKRYRHDVDAPERAPSDEAGQPLAEALAAEMLRRSRLRTQDRATTVDAELWVDPQVWEDVRARVTEAARDLHAAARPPREEGTVRVSMTTSMFRMREEARPDGVKDAS